MGDIIAVSDASKQKSASFSAITIIGTFLIAGTLAVLAYHFFSLRELAKEHSISRAKVYINQINKALDLYKLDNGSYPPNLEFLLIQQKLSSEKYLKNMPMNPWKQHYHYLSTGSSYEITCYGADGKEGGTGENADIKFYTPEK